MQGKRRPQKLQALFLKEFGIAIQSGEHDSIDDARASLLIYKKYRIQWEEHVKNRKKQKNDSKEDTKEEAKDEQYAFIFLL